MMTRSTTFMRLGMLSVIVVAVACGGEEPPRARFTRDTTAIAEVDGFVDPASGTMTFTEVRRIGPVGSMQQGISQVNEDRNGVAGTATVSESVEFFVECNGVPAASCPAPFSPNAAVEDGCVDVDSLEFDVTVRSFFPNGLRLGHVQVVALTGIENPTFDYRPCNSDEASLNVDINGTPLQQGLGLFRYGNLAPDPNGGLAGGPVTASDTVRWRWRNPGGRFRFTARFFADVCAPGECTTGAVDTRFWQAESGGVGALLEGDGVVYLGGDFRYIGPRTGAAAHVSDANVDNTADLVAAWPAFEGGDVFAIQPDGAGGAYVGGAFLTVGGGPRARLAHILADGSVDTAFPTVDDGTVRALALSRDGARLIVGGDFAAVSGTPRLNLAAIQVGTGLVDQAWVADTNGVVNAAVALGADVFVGGAFTVIDGVTAGRIARIDAASGVTSASFSAAVTVNNGAVLSLSALESSNTVYAGGTFSGTSVNGSLTRNCLFAVSGNAVLPWAPSATPQVSVVAASDNSVFAGGTFVLSSSRVAAFHPVTGARLGFRSPTNNAVESLAIAPDGTLYVGGRFTAPTPRLFAANGVTGAVLPWRAAIGPNGGADTPLAVSHDGTNLLVGGRFRSIGGRVRAGLAALDLGSGAATEWAPSLGTGSASALARASNGDVIIGGTFTTVDGQPRANLARVTEAGALDPGWAPGSDRSILALATGSDGTVYAGGTFLTLGGQPRGRLGAISDGGSVDATWIVDANGSVNAIATMRGEVYVAGAFTTLAGASHARLAAVAPVGAPNPGVVRQGFNVNATINTIDAGRDFVVVGGVFQGVGAVGRSRLAAFNRTSLLPFNPAPNGTVLGVAAAGNSIHAVGSFTTLNGPVARAGIVNVLHSTHVGVNEGMTASGSASLVAGGFHFVGGSFANASSQGALRSGLFVFAAD